MILLIVMSEVALAGSFGPGSGEDTTVAKSPLRYFFNINSGMLFCHDCSVEGAFVAAPSTIHGIEYGLWRLGGGVGLNSIGDARMMPYFGSLSTHIFGKKKRQGLILEFNYGGAHAWTAGGQPEYGRLTEITARNFLQASFGYGGYYHKMRIAVTIGVHQMDISKKYQYGVGAFYSDYYYPPSFTVVEQKLKRFFVNLSFGI
jgi:hypothetical protein